MKIKAVEIKRYCRNFINPLITSRGTIHERAGYIIRLTADDGFSGLGEAAPLAGFSCDTLDLTDENLSAAVSGLPETELPDTLDGISALATRIVPSSNPAGHFALEAALCDLAAQVAEQPLAYWLHAGAKSEVDVNFFISRPVDDWDRLRRQIQDGGYKTVKIKVGRDVDNDVDFVRRARKNLGDSISIRLDGNCGWSYAAAEEALWRLKYADIEYIEEPHKQFNPARVRDLRRVIGIKVALDESLYGSYEAEQLITGGISDVFIFKPTLLGGIARTIELARLAKRCGRRVVITSTLETEIGTAALLHLAASFGEKSCICGLDTLRLYENYDESLCTVTNGAITVPGGNGLGIDVKSWDRV